MSLLENNKIVHGGRLLAFAESLGLDDNDWLDLSTGISPFQYPIPQLASETWRELPQISNSFNESVTQYYGSNQFVVGAGSQQLIALMPEILNQQSQNIKRVFIPQVGYKSHQVAWSSQQVEIVLYTKLPKRSDLKEGDCLVIINPNNPSGIFYSKHCLSDYAKYLDKINGYLIVDEAFIDVVDKSTSLINKTMPASLIVFRSIGKFFGLAGLRVGFVFANIDILKYIKNKIEPWQVNGPALAITELALNDIVWQKNQKIQLTKQASSLKALLEKYFPAKTIKGCDLFLTLSLDNANEIYMELAQHKIYVRLCDENDAIRFGVPNNTDLARLEKTFKFLFKPVE